MRNKKDLKKIFFPYIIGYYIKKAINLYIPRRNKYYEPSTTKKVQMDQERT